MNVVEQLLDIDMSDEKTFRTGLINFLHFVQFSDEKTILKETSLNLAEFYESTTSVKFLRVCMIATILEYKCNRQRIKCSEWAKSKDLAPTKPYFPDGYIDFRKVLEAPQEFLNHNVFFAEVSMCVM